MGRRVIIERGGNAREIDEKIKNKWNWNWLEKEVNGVGLFNFMKKLNKPGFSLCEWCDCEVNYSGKGLSSLIQHAETNKHKTVASTRKSNYALPSSYQDAASSKDKAKETTSAPYGLHPSFRKLFNSAQVQQTMPTTKPVVPVEDRTANSEAKVLAFMAEKRLPFDLAGDLVSLIKNISKDPQALNSMSLSSASAAYKLKFGVAQTLEESVVECLQKNFFSMNIDEATSKGYSRVLGILVSYYNESQGQIVTHHLASVELISVTSLSLFQALEDLFSSKEIPWSNVMSILMDSCNVMRGPKSGLEVRIKTSLAPHLLDVDGDSCHHAHNASRRLCAAFQGLVERLFTDIFTDFKWSSDQREYISEICALLDIKFTKPARYVPHRWLSMFDVAVSFQRMFKAYLIFYALFVIENNEVRNILKDQGLSGMSDNAKIKKITDSLKKKSQTKEGKETKSRITKTLFEEHKYLKLVLSFYINVLPLLKSYVCLFESGQPLIHLMYEKQEQLLTKTVSLLCDP